MTTAHGRTLLVAALILWCFVPPVAVALDPRRLKGLVDSGLPEALEHDAHSVVFDHSLIPPFLADHAVGTPALSHWSFGGSAIATDGYVRLTPAQASREGYLWNEVPISVKSWSIYAAFRTFNNGGIGADGFALWISDRPVTHGGPVMGMPATGFEGIGVLFDTFDNDRSGDTPAVYVTSITKDSKEEDMDPSADFANGRLGQCSFQYRNTPAEDPAVVVVSYDHVEQTLSVRLRTPLASGPCVEIKDLVIPTGRYLGFTGHTGGLSDNHDILSVAFIAEVPEYPVDITTDEEANTFEGVDERLQAAEDRLQGASFGRQQHQQRRLHQQQNLRRRNAAASEYEKNNEALVKVPQPPKEVHAMGSEAEREQLRRKAERKKATNAHKHPEYDHTEESSQKEYWKAKEPTTTTTNSPSEN